MSGSDRSKVIVLVPRPPWPLDDGGRIGLWQVTWSAAQAYDVTLLTLVPPREAEQAVPEEVHALGIRVVAVTHTPPPTWRAAWMGAVGRWPFTLERYASQALRRRLASLVEEMRPAFVLVNHLHLYPAVADLEQIPFVLREHNVEFSWMSRYAQSQGFTPRGIFARFQAARLRAVEAEACQRAGLVLAIQPHEADLLRRLAPGAALEELPIGVDFGRFHDPLPVDPPVVLLAGSFAWPPNAEGALRFLREGWPRVRAAEPRTRLRLAGKDPPARLAEEARRVGAEAVGYVASMEDEFARASLLLVPLWVGAGARVKVVEALGARLPVVSTRLGVEGLGLEAGKHFLQADSPEGLANGVLQLLRSPERRSGIIEEGRRFADRAWSLSGVARRQNELCEQMLSRLRS